MENKLQSFFVEIVIDYNTKKIEVEYFVTDEFCKNNLGYADVICRFIDPKSQRKIQIDERYEINFLSNNDIVRKIAKKIVNHYYGLTD